MQVVVLRYQITFVLTPLPSEVPSPRPSPQPTVSPQPTTSFAPTLLPSLSVVPTSLPTSAPTTDSFLCTDLWPSLVGASQPLPLVFAETQKKWAPVLTQETLRLLNLDPDWCVGEIWTLQAVVSSTCPNELGFGFYGAGGFHMFQAEPLAEEVEITVLDRVGRVPTMFTVRNKCRQPAEVTFKSLKLGKGVCTLHNVPTPQPTFTPAPSVSASPTSQSPAPTTSPSPGLVLPPSSAPRPVPTPAPTSTKRPTVTAPPSVAPSYSLVPSRAPSSVPTTDTFTCPDVWGQLLGDIQLPLRFTNTQRKWAQVLTSAQIKALNAYPTFKTGEVWTLQVVASSTCETDLGFSFYGAGGSLLLKVPALAESVELTIVGVLKKVPTYFAARNKCRNAGAEVTFSNFKIGHGVCFGGEVPTPAPTTTNFPTAAPTITYPPSVSKSPTPPPSSTVIPSLLPTPYLGSESPTITHPPTASLVPSSYPTVTRSPSPAPSVMPTTDSFTCANLWPALVPGVALPLTFSETRTKHAAVVADAALGTLHEEDRWEEGALWTLQVLVSSTCPSELVFGFSGGAGSHVVRVPGLAENVELTVSDRLPEAARLSKLELRNKCVLNNTDVEFESVKRAVDEAVATFGWSPYRAELSLFWTDSEGKPTVCGQAELLLKDKDGALVVVDLKRTDHDLSRSKIPYGDVACAAPQLERFYASDHARYSLQTSSYCVMIEQRLEVTIAPEDRWLLQAHPSMPKAVWIRCRDLDAEAREILAGVKGSGGVQE